GHAADVVRRAVDLDPVQSLNLEADPGQRAGDLGREPLAGMRRVDPVTDLSCAAFQSGVQAGAADEFGLAAIKHAVGEVLPEVELATELTQPLDLCRQRLRLG